MRTIPVAVNGGNLSGSRLSDHLQIRIKRLCQIDISAFSGQNKVTKMCPKYLLTHY